MAFVPVRSKGYFVEVQQLLPNGAVCPAMVNAGAVMSSSRIAPVNGQHAYKLMLGVGGEAKAFMKCLTTDQDKFDRDLRDAQLIYRQQHGSVFGVSNGGHITNLDAAIPISSEVKIREPWEGYHGSDAGTVHPGSKTVVQQMCEAKSIVAMRATPDGQTRVIVNEISSDKYVSNITSSRFWQQTIDPSFGSYEDNRKRLVDALREESGQRTHALAQSVVSQRKVPDLSDVWAGCVPTAGKIVSQVEF